MSTAEPSGGRVSNRFVAAYSAAQIAVFVSFVPLLTILAPLKAEAIDPADKTQLLSTALFYGAVTAGFANVAAGVLSDATRSRWGRRTPWMAAGAVGTAASYLAMLGADSAAGFIAGLIAFQFCLNLLFAPLVAVLPDQVPDAQKGSVSAFLALGYPVGAIIGAVLIGKLIEDETARYLALAAITVLIAPVSFLLREPPHPPALSPVVPAPTSATRDGTPPRADYLWTWASRFLVQTAVSIASGYLLFYLSDVVGYARERPARTVEEGVATLLIVSTAANVGASLAAGFLSDRVRRRKPFLIAAAACIGLALALMAIWPSWSTMLAAQALFGAAFGCYTAVDLALVAQVLPSRAQAGRYLALMNFANTLPQVVAPVAAMRLTGAFANGYQVLFAAAGGVALLGALAIIPIRRVR